MKNALKALMLSAALLAPMAASATDHKDVVRDVRGDVVRDIRGNCVITKWEGGDNKCEAGKPADLFSRMEVVYFDYNKTGLRAEEQAKLDAFVIANQDAKNLVTFRITGFADKTGNADYNRRLSQRRAQTVSSYLASKGLNVNVAEVEGLGATQSVTDCSSPNKQKLIQCLAPDRRVEITVEGQKK